MEAQKDNLLGLLNSKADFKNLKCIDIIDLSSKNPYYAVEETASLQDAIDLLVKWSVHLLPIVDSENGDLKTLFTQSQMISFLQKHITKAPFAHKTISALNLGIKDVISINHNEMTIKAFRLIFEKKIQGIAILDDNGSIVGNISASDLKIIGHTASLLPILLKPLKEFSTLLPTNKMIPGPVNVSPSNTIEELFFKINLTKVHRVYVVDQRNLIGVISLLDLLSLFANH